MSFFNAEKNIFVVVLADTKLNLISLSTILNYKVNKMHNY